MACSLSSAMAATARSARTLSSLSLRYVCAACSLRPCLIAPAQAASHFYGVVLKTENLPYPNHGHVILAKPAPILMYPVRARALNEPFYFLAARIFAA